MLKPHMPTSSPPDWHRDTVKRPVSSDRTRLALGGTYAASWPTIALYAVPSLWVNLLYDQTRLGGDPWAWLAVSFVAYGATVVPVIIARYTVLRVDTARAPRPFVALVVYVVAAVTRVACAVPLGMSWGIFPREELTYRILSAPLNVVFWMVLITALVDATVRHRSRMRELVARRAELTELRTSIDAVIAADARSLKNTVTHALEPSLALLRLRVNSADPRCGDDMVSSLRSAIDDVVRPMSERIAHSADQPHRETNPVVRPGRWWGVPVRIRVRDVLMPGTVALIALYAGFVPTLAMQGWEVTLFLVAPTALFTWIVGAGVRLRWGHITLPVGGPLALTVGVYSASSAVAAAVALVAFPTIPATLVAQFAATIVAIALTVAAFRLVTVTRESTLRETSATNAALAVTMTEMRQRLWVSRTHLATTLHGPVQAAFQVAALRIAHAPAVTSELIDELDASVREALALLDEPVSISREQILQLRDDIISMWSSVCDITIDIAPAVLDFTADHPAAVRCVVEVLRESVTNAVKHGSARTIDIEVTARGRVVSVIARNDGEPPAPDWQPGYGFRAVDEFARSWSLTHVAPSTVLEVQIPLSADTVHAGP